MASRPGVQARDHVRHHRAKQAIHEHRDKLLKQSDKKTNWKDLMAQELGNPKGRARVLAIGTLLSLGSMISYAIMQYLWFRVYHFSFATTFLSLFSMVTIGCFMVLAANPKVGGFERGWLRWLGVLFVVSALVSTVVGGMLYFKSLAYYWRYKDLRPYTNVAGGQNGAAFADASMFLWTEDTRLDALRSVGFRSKFTGQVYCVAPIVDGTMSDTAPISYYAVGENCCNARAEFHCGDSTDATVRSALVLLEPEEVVRSFMTWAVQGAVYPRYENAINLQRATYGSTSAQSVKLVYWTKDPIATMNAFYDDASTRAIWVGVIYFVILDIWACMITMKFILTPIEKIDGAIRAGVGIPIGEKV